MKDDEDLDADALLTVRLLIEGHPPTIVVPAEIPCATPPPTEGYEPGADWW